MAYTKIEKKQHEATDVLLNVLNQLMWRAAPWTAADKLKVAKQIAKKYKLEIKKA